MRTILSAAVLALGVGLAIQPSAAAAPIGAASHGPDAFQSMAERVQYWGGGGGYCARLRRACQYKEERGEVGYGHCRRYREECGGGVSYCERLRRACVHKYERGEVGEGNCRRYRSECGRRW
jgi:hypothetical protein